MVLSGGRFARGGMGLVTILLLAAAHADYQFDAESESDPATDYTFCECSCCVFGRGNSCKAQPHAASIVPFRYTPAGSR